MRKKESVGYLFLYYSMKYEILNGRLKKDMMKVK